MTPHHCLVKHDPEAGKYGDCVRACVASLFDVVVCDDVPHFFHDNDPAAGRERLNNWLRSQGAASFFIHYDGSNSFIDLLNVIGGENPDAHYMLFGSTSAGPHVVVCHGSRVVHDPSWISGPMVGPGPDGVWSIMLVVRA